MTSTVTHPLLEITTPGQPRLVARGLVKRFGATTALAGVDLELGEEEALAVMGPSGSGKSTLLHVLAGILTPDEGTVALRGRHVEGMSERERALLRRGRFGFVFQHGQLLSELTALENVALAAMLDGEPRAQAEGLAAQWLARLGLAGELECRPGEMSAGQVQRAAVARALVTRPDVVFADEPAGLLDEEASRDVARVLVDATRATGASLVVVTRDARVAGWCDRRVHVRDGRVAPADVSATRVTA
ncbi:ABC transporter ATP-binding protein [Cellulomonas palmilytica]|uniref:ABC transporter ATP-binding protein n=1 Tax=Cellulomonas palmilytica TaxID=2608402 RepID=UPI001F2F9DA7|nr:ABC transporter ATP-binding protein [Cellulomonas palmilytica]UJP39391.1 ABC transporter ATP-binding protein [Cellulomonas palmilytica]